MSGVLRGHISQVLCLRHTGGIIHRYGGSRCLATASSVPSAKPATPKRELASGKAPIKAAFAELKRRTQIKDNHGKVQTKYVHKVVSSAASEDDVPLAVAAVAISNSKRQASPGTGDILVRSILKSTSDKKAALDKVLSVFALPHSKLKLSGRGASELLRAGREAGDADVVKRTLQLMRDQGIAPGEETVLAAIEAAFASKQPGLAVRLYMWRLNFRAGQADERALFRLSKGLLASASPRHVLRLKDKAKGKEEAKDAKAPAKDEAKEGEALVPLSPVGQQLLSHLESVVAKIERSASVGTAAAAESAAAAGTEAKKTVKASPALKGMLVELVAAIKSGKTAAPGPAAEAPAAEAASAQAAPAADKPAAAPAEAIKA